ncbi:hypothetical protein SNE40_019786 [Patella caerulea]|uniref:Uncharacterized protein n=1 Tax=Patella caerulea TaxID=87958 RepID=A0AAN8G6C2_PATCE
MFHFSEGLKELKVFVDLAFISAGEGDLDIDKVNCFHAVTSAFAPLIFDLKQDSKFDEVMNKCNLVWKELQNDKNLTNKLHDTNNQLDWFKAVRQSHGSVEVTSLKQAEMIVAQGIYKIGFPKDKTSKTQLEVSKVLSLNVPELKEKKEHGSGKYTYAKLMDLQSRLMLVAGQAEKGNENIDIFTAVLDGAVRLAKSFVKLCTDGCVFFNSWKVQFLCNSSREVCAFLSFGKDQILKGHRNPDNVVDFIGNLANFLEKCHEDWMKYLNDKREEYLELNYFTVEQLVFLQQEIIKAGQDELDPLIYPMLSLVKQDCSRNDLIEAMKLAMTSVSDKDKNMETLETTIEVELSEDEQKDEFIQYMLDNGFSLELAQKAYLNVKDKGDKDEGINHIYF